MAPATSKASAFTCSSPVPVSYPVYRLPRRPSHSYSHLVDAPGIAVPFAIQYFSLEETPVDAQARAEHHADDRWRTSPTKTHRPGADPR
jgi:hypothetical protein